MKAAKKKEKKETITIELPKGISQKELQKFLDKEANRSWYLGYSPGQFFPVSGTGYADAKSYAVEEFIKKYVEEGLFPPDIEKRHVGDMVEVRKLGKLYTEDIKGVIEIILLNYKASPPRKGQKGGRKKLPVQIR